MGQVCGCLQLPGEAVSHDSKLNMSLLQDDRLDQPNHFKSKQAPIETAPRNEINTYKPVSPLEDSNSPLASSPSSSYLFEPITEDSVVFVTVKKDTGAPKTKSSPPCTSSVSVFWVVAL